jgi:hypothetical protein
MRNKATFHPKFLMSPISGHSPKTLGLRGDNLDEKSRDEESEDASSLGSLIMICIPKATAIDLCQQALALPCVLIPIPPCLSPSPSSPAPTFHGLICMAPQARPLASALLTPPIALSLFTFTDCDKMITLIGAGPGLV